MVFALKIFIAALVAVIASEVARRSVALGAVIVALPLTSMIAMSFLYADTKDMQKVSNFAASIPLAVMPSLLFFGIFVVLAKMQLGFAATMGISTLAMLVCYALYLKLT